MNKKLEKVCEEKRERYITQVFNGEASDKLNAAFEIGFQAAIESKEVQGLIHALKEISANNINNFTDYGLLPGQHIAMEALEAFEGE